MYEVLIEDKAVKQLKKVPLPERKTLIHKIKQLQIGFRLRVGDYRILFTKDDPAKEIKVYIIARRDDVYSM